MTFNQLLDINPKVRVADLIQLFLLGYDDKIYINIAVTDRFGDIEFILEDVRIISDDLEPYYEKHIKWFEQEPEDEPTLGFLTLVI